MLSNTKGEVLLMFPKHVSICDSNEAKVLSILEALWLFFFFFHGRLIVESDSSNTIEWVSNQKVNPWKFQFHFNEIQE